MKCPALRRASPCCPATFRAVRVSRLPCRCSPDASTSAKPVASTSPDLTLRCSDEEGGGVVHVFGVEHCKLQPHIGEWVLRNKPDALVLESEVTTTHGAENGNVITCQDHDPTAGSFLLRNLCAVAAQLEKEEEPWSCALYKQVSRQMNGEQQAVVAAFTTGARVLFGDRPKAATLKRLLNRTTMADLDQGFALQSARNYLEILQEYNAVPDGMEFLLHGKLEGKYHHILMTEREAALCHACQSALAAADPDRRCVAAVVGSAHLPGLKELWDSGAWRRMAQADAASDVGSLWDASEPPPKQSTAQEQEVPPGVRRGLLDATLALSCRPEVVDASLALLGGMSEEETADYSFTKEVYTSCRMLLAALPRELLPSVVSGWRCDMWQELQPVRGLRPVEGGPGYSIEGIEHLRELYFQPVDPRPPASRQPAPSGFTDVA